MVERSGPFSSAKWAEADWFAFASVWSASGVLPVGDYTALSAGQGPLAFTAAGLSVSASAGSAFVAGASYATDATVSRTVTPNTHATQFRRDRLVLRRDLAAKSVDVVWLQGVPSLSPQPHVLNRDLLGQWDLPLHSFLVPPAISGAIDERGWLIGSGDVAYVAAGARTANHPTPTEGARVIVAGAPQVFRAGQWRGVVPLLYATNDVDASVFTDDHAVMTLNVADPGWPYRLLISPASVWLLQLGAGVAVRPKIRVNGADVIPWGEYQFNPGGTTQLGLLLTTPGGSATGTLAGPSTVTFFIDKDIGPAGNGFQAQDDGAFSTLAAQVIPV
jgi:hypothetical protein